MSYMVYMDARIQNMFILAGIFFVAYQFVTVLNNLYDVRADIINNNPQNPLVSEVINKRVLTGYVLFISLVLLVLLVISGSMRTVLLSLAFVALGCWYSMPTYGAARMHYIGTIVLVAWYVWFPALLAWGYADMVPSTLWYLTLLQSALVASWLLTKDYKDIKGDKMVGKLTPLLRFGAKHIAVVSIVLVTISMALSIYIPTISIGSKVAVVLCQCVFGWLVYLCHRRKQQQYRVAIYVLLTTAQLIVLLSTS